jgi:Beta-propeller repeat
MGFGIAVDKDKNAYVTGFTSSKGFPTTPATLKPQ